MMFSEIRNFIDHTHEITDDQLIEALGLLDKANKKGFVCPSCKNGTGKDGDGLIINPKSKGRYHCFRCDKNFDLIDLVAKRYGLNQSEAIRKTANLLNYPLTENRKMKSKSKKVNTCRGKVNTYQPQDDSNSSTEVTSIDTKTKSIFKALAAQDGTYFNLIKTASEILQKNYDQTSYLKERGISKETAAYYNMGLLDHFEIGGYNFDECIVITGSYEGYAVRNTNPNADNKERYRKVSGGIDIPLGLRQIVAEPDKRDSKTGYLEPVFLVEGYFDAPSFYEVGADAISLNGIGNTQIIIDSFKEFKVHRPVILALDNDETGIKQQNRNYQELEEAGIAVYQVDNQNFYKCYKDANEYLTREPESFLNAVLEAKGIPVKEFNKTFNKSRFEAFRDHVKNNAKTDRLLTGFTKLDSQDYLDGGLFPGLYVIGSVSSLGKTAFTLQLSDNLATSGNDVLFISLEMSEHELRARSISRYTFIESGFDPEIAKSVREILDGRRYQNYSEYELEIIEKACSSYFQDTGEHLRIIEGLGNINADDIAKMVEEHTYFRGKPPVVVIDYLQLLIQSRDKKYNMTEKQVIDFNIYRLKQISRDFNTPIIAISSFNRDNYHNDVSMLSFLGSSAIEYSSDVLIGLERKEEANKKVSRESTENKEFKTGIRDISLKILKNRNAVRGKRDTFKYDLKYNYFREVEESKNNYSNFIFD